MGRESTFHISTSTALQLLPLRRTPRRDHCPFVQAGEDLEARTPADSATPLHLAAQDGQLDVDSGSGGGSTGGVQAVSFTERTGGDAPSLEEEEDMVKLAPMCNEVS